MRIRMQRENPAGTASFFYSHEKGFFEYSGRGSINYYLHEHHRPGRAILRRFVVKIKRSSPSRFGAFLKPG